MKGRKPKRFRLVLMRMDRQINLIKQPVLWDPAYYLLHLKNLLMQWRSSQKTDAIDKKPVKKVLRK